MTEADAPASQFGDTSYIFGDKNSLVDEFLSLPGAVPGRSMSPVFFDGIPGPQLAEALARNDVAGQRAHQQNRYWSTVPRLCSDGLSEPIRDVMEVDLAQARLVNRISFDLAHFPQVAELEFTDRPDGIWRPVRHSDGTPVVIRINESNPPVLPTQVARQGTGHPQHFGANHWTSYDLDVRCLVGGVITPAAVFRLVLHRPYSPDVPVDALGTPVAYALGVRAFACGYAVEQRSDVPHQPLRQGSITEHQPFAQTRDILGSTQSFALRETPAGNLLLDGIWRSEPQPVNYAVVNLYVNLGPRKSTETGEDDTGLTVLDAIVLDQDPADFDGIVIDRVFLDPLVSGCTVNLYTTLDEPNEGAERPWEAVRWTPVNRDFKLRRGIYRLNPTKAKYLKLEFTHLGAQPYEANVAQVRTVQVFNQNIFINYLSTRSDSSPGAGTEVMQTLADVLRYADGGQMPTVTDNARGYTPTEVFWSDDPNAASRLLNVSSTYNFQSWQGQMVAPRFVEIGTHNYTEVEVLHDRRVAYYAGLRALEVYRVNQDAVEDTDQYLEHFHDDHNLSTIQGWILGDGDLSTPPPVQGEAPVPNVVVSKVLPSKSNVIGVQYATTQTPAIDLLAQADSDFNSVLKAADKQRALTGPNGFWVGIGDAAPYIEGDTEIVNPSPSTLYNTDIGTTVRVKRKGTAETVPRSTKPHTYASIGLRYGTWGNIRTTYSDLDAGVSTREAESEGGIRNLNVITPAVGSRVYAAGRVISPVALENPLTLRLVNAAGRSVAEAQAPVPANQVVEWFVDYTVGEGSAVYDVNLYREFEAAEATFEAQEQFSYKQLEATRIPQPEDLYVEMVQKGVPNSSWYVDTLSVYEDPILWEFSNNGGATWWPAYNIRNNPNGVLTFPTDSEVAPLNTWDDIQGVYQGEDTFPNNPRYNALTGSYESLEGTTYRKQPKRNALRWRATCNREGVHINALSVRPWYDAYEGGVPADEGVAVSGPSIASYDHYQPIKFDPRYRMWNRPIPQGWWFFYRQFLLLQHIDLLVRTSGGGTYLADTVIDPEGLSDQA